MPDASRYPVSCVYTIQHSGRPHDPGTGWLPVLAHSSHASTYTHMQDERMKQIIVDHNKDVFFCVCEQQAAAAAPPPTTTIRLVYTPTHGRPSATTTNQVQYYCMQSCLLLLYAHPYQAYLRFYKWYTTLENNSAAIIADHH